MNKQRVGRDITHSQEPREPSPKSPVSASMTSHQRRWSADPGKCGSPHVITVRKNKKEPEPPQRRTSLLKPPAATDSLSKRFSCPHIGILSSPSSSASSSNTSSCSSPPPIQTSTITGQDPQGWRIHPKSSFTNSQARRLSLEIPLPAVAADCKARPVPNSKPDNSLKQDRSPKIKPSVGAKPSRRRHSDSSAFLKSPAKPLPLVTLEVLGGVRLRRVTQSYESDDVFSEGREVESPVTPQRKTPPPVPEKTSTARQVAQLIRCAPVSTKTTQEDIYSRLMTPKSNQTDLHAPKSGLHLETSSSPRFPGREI